MKRGSIFDVVTIPIMLAVLFFAVFVCYYLLTQLNVQFQAMGLGGETVTQSVLDGWLVWDSLFVLAYVFFLIGSIASAWTVQTNPLYFIFFIFMLGLTFLITGALYEFSAAVFGTSLLGGYQAQFPYITLFMSNLVPIMFATGSLIGLALFVRLR